MRNLINETTYSYQDSNDLLWKRRKKKCRRKNVDEKMSTKKRRKKKGRKINVEGKNVERENSKKWNVNHVKRQNFSDVDIDIYWFYSIRSFFFRLFFCSTFLFDFFSFDVFSFDVFNTYHSNISLNK